MNQLPAKAIGSCETRAGEFYRGPADAVFDVNLLRKACEEVMERVAPMVTDRAGDRVTCVSLTHRPEAVDPLSDGLQSQFAPDGTLRYLESEFTCFNEEFADTYFATVWRSVTALMPVGRMRLMIVGPQQLYRMHADATKRAHLAIHTDPDAFLVGPDGQGHHVPADGRLRVFDTRLRHTAFNAGTTERVHLTMSVANTERRHHTALLQRAEEVNGR
ncbi:aspartyl/asparaginyl beta-hydroxylase domain-containing protein [Nocardia wallacei]|uniref:aspartyl/asparaginyl beta-hydroxylase domain-containing protein n=1 Tax=Nocardia wallacei TaxID=480035 RepID=UPI0024567802|nr:aspartyl/asparaginyl beta-hydroxylase domain-containing protein [Nocardia wallacei]